MDESILNKAKEQFDKMSERARDMVNDQDSLKELIESAKSKMDEMKLGEGLENLPIIFSMLKSYVTGEYKEIPITSIVALIAALLYFVNPNDIISDKVPIIGMIDDAAIIVLCLKVTSGDVEKYKKWLKENGKEV